MAALPTFNLQLEIICIKAIRGTLFVILMPISNFMNYESYGVLRKHIGPFLIRYI